MSVAAEPLAVPALDLKAQYQTIREEIEHAIRGVIESQHFILGPEVAGLEAELARYCGAPHAVGCASGSDALLLPLLALGVGPGDEVVTSPYSFFATAGAIWRTGARPVFVDIEPDTFNIDPSRLKAAVTTRTKAIIPVHLYGQTADMDPINAIAETHGLPVLEDAAQAIGASYHGHRAGTLGLVAAFSFYPSKNLGGFGDAGMITTSDQHLASQVARLRVHGMEPKYHHHDVGFNSRLDALQAAVLRVKLRYLDTWTAARREVAARYFRMFDAHGLANTVQLPVERHEHFHVYNQFVIRVPGAARDALRAHLGTCRIGTEIYYPIPLHLQVSFKSLRHQQGDFPRSESAAQQTIALPIYPELSEEAQQHVVGSIAEFFHDRGSA
ncbi:MAG TPA: DegT/DnrJ/EryC1/StrS family aminotransferase [Isosphaeraceae bacterium]|jgi:dTDP-4-amino-4,6-dideoxygalactose transaminase|nr:DegT/DnrJ/EryC1/StrS family aminotransferase [Isosphaeraceae bacterium]